MSKIKRYEEYKLQWMIDHGYSLNDLIDKLGKIADQELNNNGRLPFSENFDEAFEILENEQGFAESEIWACYDEWEDYEGSEEDE